MFAVNNGAWVISNGWSWPYNAPNIFPVVVDAIQFATTQGRSGKGCVVVFSPGNDANHAQGINGYVNFPASVTVPGVFAVGASDRYDLQANYSPTSDPNSSFHQILDIVAPSHRSDPSGIEGETVEVWSIDTPGNNGLNPYPQPNVVHPPDAGEQLPGSGIDYLSYTGRFGGTSAAAPQVAAVAALLLSLNPDLTQQQVFDIITGTADKVGGYSYTNGWSREFGYGRLNACKAAWQVFSSLPNSISGPALVCSSATFSLQNLPANPNIISWSSSNPTALSINSNGTAMRLNNFNGQVTITAAITSGCGTANITRSVWVGTRKPTGFISVLVDPYLGRIKARVEPVPNATGYEWYLDGVKYTGPGANSDYVTMPISRNNCSIPDYSIGVKAKNACGTSSGYYELHQNPCYGGNHFSYFPNPASDILVIEKNFKNNSKNDEGTTSSGNEIRTLHYYRLYDFDRNEVVLEGALLVKTEIDVAKLSKGRYILKIQVDKDQEETHHIIIN